MKTRNAICSAGAIGALVMTASGVWAANAKVCFEAESATSVKSPIKKVMAGANREYSGRGFVEIPWDRNLTKGIGQATYRFNVKKAGVYYIWARTFWANGCGNSIAASVNGSDAKILGEDGTYDKWHWVGGAARVSLKAGANTLTLKNRETGVRVDQFFFCQDGDYIPTTTRKVTT